MMQRLKERFFDLEGEEWPRALGLALFFFLVIAVFWVLKPMKSGMFLSYFSANPVEVLGWTLSGAQAEQLARVLNMVVAYLVVIHVRWLSVVSAIVIVGWILVVHY